jgi:Tfp pilus assembly protein FimT
MSFHSNRVLGAVAILLSGLAVSCGCPSGRTKAPDGSCVREEVIDFGQCVQNAAGKTISSEDAKKLSATVQAVGGSAEWQTKLSAKYDGPNEEGQRKVIEQCTAMMNRAQPGTKAAKDGLRAGEKIDAVRKRFGSPAKSDATQWIYGNCIIKINAKGRVESWENCPGGHP